LLFPAGVFYYNILVLNYNLNMPWYPFLSQPPFDSEELELILFIAIIILLFLILVKGISRPPARQHPWIDLAARSGLSFDPGRLLGVGPNVTGKYHRHDLFLRTLTRGSKNKVYTHILMDISNKSNLYLLLYDEDTQSKIANRLGARPIKSGDDTFDERFVAIGQPTNLAVNLLSNANLREKLLQARLLNIEIFDQHLHYERIDEETDINYLLFLFDLLDEIAENVDILQQY
jgi:hypothetical protein